MPDTSSAPPSRKGLILDLAAVITLILLAYLFWWRLLTPERINQQSLIEGDFSGQFVSFATYQAARMSQGQIPLWNPYNLGGHPFLADTQAAVFYPPRLITIALANLSSGGAPTPPMMYDWLQREMIAHSLLSSLLMYLFMRRLTKGAFYSPAAGMIGAIIFAYGGFMTGYPPLQLALMEACIWLPLAMLGIVEATRHPAVRWGWFGVSGIALALSLLAGHPQTALLFAYLTIGYLGWRVYTQRRPFLAFVIGTLLMVGIGAGIAAVQLLPSWEYLRLTTREGLSFVEKGNGFPLYDVLQMVFPGLFSQWSPLYISVIGLMLAGYLCWKHPNAAGYWFLALIAALGLSFGARSILYDIFYNFLPGFNLFREQERSAYLIAFCGAVLAGMGANYFLEDTWDEDLKRNYKVAFGGVIAPALGIGFTVFANWITEPSSESAQRFGLIAFSLFAAVLAAITLISVDNFRRLFARGAVVTALVAIELFSFSRMVNPNMESVPTQDRLAPSEMVRAVGKQQTSSLTLAPWRVDGVPENYGTAYGPQFSTADIRGTSPLRLASVDKLLRLNNPARLWEVFAVKYVISPNLELPVPSSIVAEAGDLRLHALDQPRPLARLVSKVWVEADDAAALGFLNEPAFDSANTVILPADPGVNFAPKIQGAVELIRFDPERIELKTQTDGSAILNLSLVYYPGWEATLDGAPAALLRADTAMSALVVPAGEHTVVLRFEPPSYTMGMLLSLMGIVITGGFLGVAFFIDRRKTAPAEPAAQG